MKIIHTDTLTHSDRCMRHVTRFPYYHQVFILTTLYTLYKDIHSSNSAFPHSFWGVKDVKDTVAVFCL